MNGPVSISLLPAATEMVFALGAGDNLAGVSHECDFPPAARTIPVVVKPALPLETMTLSEIDTAVAQRIGSGKSLYEVDERLLDGNRAHTYSDSRPLPGVRAVRERNHPCARRAARQAANPLVLTAQNRRHFWQYARIGRCYRTGGKSRNLDYRCPCAPSKCRRKGKIRPPPSACVLS